MDETGKNYDYAMDVQAQQKKKMFSLINIF